MHHNSAPSHTNKHTWNFLFKNNMSYFTHEQWSSYSRNLSPWDYILNGYTKNEVMKSHNFKWPEKSEFCEIEKVPQEFIINAPKLYHNYNGEFWKKL